ncbi:terminase small subunit [Acinetobacter puyangensis]|uniref:terminase small subunit n=1 Tax=Acinetobacter puyangensis TaxID=1096779 RepID=UPI003A4D774C
MALTAKKKAFAHAKMDGADNKQAAIFAGYSPESASAAGSRLSKDSDVVSYIEKYKNVKADVKDVKATEKPVITNTDIQNAKNLTDPLAFLESVYSDPVEDMALRVNAAKAALPYVHGKVAEKGKKETKQDKAKESASTGRYATRGARRQLPS